MTIRFISSAWSAIQRRQVAIGFTLVALLWLWIGWLGYRYVIAPTPSEDQITDQIVKLNAASLQRINDQVKNYRTVKDIPTVKPSLFSVGR